MQDREYKNVEKKEALWKEVAHEVGCDGKYTLECDSLLILFHRLISRDLSSLVVEVKKEMERPEGYLSEKVQGVENWREKRRRSG